MNFLVTILLSVLFIATSLSASKAPFIDKCEWNDKACIMTSSQKAQQLVAAGLPGLGVPAFDPLPLDQVISKEDELQITFKDMIIKGVNKCKIINMERKSKGTTLLFAVECPIDVTGTYTAKGKLILVPIEGDGKFSARTNNIYISGKMKLITTEGSDGKKYWKIGNRQHTFDPKEKFALNFENLFNGNMEKAKPILQILDQSWKELIMTVGKPLVNEIVNKIIDGIDKFFQAVPIEELEN